MLRCLSLIIFLAFNACVSHVLAFQISAPQELNMIKMTPELLWKLGRLGEAAVSKDGKTVAYTVRSYSLKENSGKTTLHLLDLQSGQDIGIIQGWGALASIQWVGDGDQSRIYFEGTGEIGDATGTYDSVVSSPTTGDDELGQLFADLEHGVTADDEKKSPASQAWYLDLKTRATVQVTSVVGGISNLKVSPDGQRLAYTARVKMRSQPVDLYPDLPKADARISDGLMYRHWKEWADYKFSHIFISDINEKGCCGESFDLMEGIEADCPVPPFGGAEQFDWAPDSSEIAFTMKRVADWAQSTNSDVYTIKVEPGQAPVNITPTNMGYDLEPAYAPDGRSIAFLSMKRAGFESDRARIMIYDRESKQSRELSEGFDQTAHTLHWDRDSKKILFTSETRGTKQIYSVDVDAQIASGQADDFVLRPMTQGRYDWDIAGLMNDSRFLLVKRMDMLRPQELVMLDRADGSVKRLSKINDAIYENLELPIVEERYVEATDGKKIHTWVIYPPNFDPQSKKTWPMLTYCQGGPQGQIGQGFSYRWNFHLMAAKGYVVVAPNRRGLPGFGRQWNDQISQDWGGQAMQDLLSATDSLVAEPYIDKTKVAAVGASFGGYSVYWMMGNHQNRFSAMIAHCGVFNLESMYGATEELFFMNWEMGGPYWKSKQLQQNYERFSPHKFVGNWETPLLVIHNQLDFRVPVTQGMEAFTAAQVRKVPSRFLYFPGEGHWVQSPQNSVLWQRVFFDWLQRYCPPPQSALPKTVIVPTTDEN